MNQPTPRVDSAMLRDHIGDTVRLVGKVLQLQPPNRALLEAADHGQVNIKLTNDSTIGTRFVEVIGRVESNDTVQEYVTLDLGEDFDISLYQQMLPILKQHPQLFE
ncbi:replication factor A protein 3 [Syncephalis fuscata]|nr:replication factor A protein 3 [Syncephalis fuscata]